MKSPLAAFAVMALFATPALATLNLSTKPSKNMDCTAGVCTATAADAVLNVGDLETLLVSSDVQVSTESLVAQDMQILAPLGWTSGRALTLTSNNAITIQKPITVSGVAHLTLNVAGGPAYLGTGAIRFASKASALTIDGDDYVLADSITSLAAAIKANEYGFVALANNYDAAADGQYTRTPVGVAIYGTVDGLGNTISNYSVDDGGGSYASLLGVTGRGATVRNLGLANAQVAGGNTTGFGGILLGYNSGQIVDCHATGSVNLYAGGTAAGGLSGVNSGKIYRSWTDAQVQLNGDGTVGGLVGIASKGAIVDSYALGNVSLSLSGSIGGLVGTNAGRVHSSYAAANVAGTGLHDYIGGAYGQSSMKSKNTYWDTDVGGTAAVGWGNSFGVTGLTTAALQSRLPAGFDHSVWGQNAKLNNGLPYILTNPPRQ